jgi:hypothetical protein
MDKTAEERIREQKQQQLEQLSKIGQSAFESVEEMIEELRAARQTDDEERIEAAEEVIRQDPLSARVRSDWQAPGETLQPAEYELLLSWGGPATRIVGELSEYGEPVSAKLQVQDWFTPWTEYIRADRDILLEYAQQFYFGV